MSTTTARPLIAAAAFAWFVVGGSGLAEILAGDSSDNWELPYSIFAIALLLGALLTVVAVGIASRPADRSPVRVIGLAVLGLGVLSTIVAWAIPLWMTILAVGFILVALSGSQSWRRPVAFLAGAQLLGMLTMFAGIAAELGPTNEYGDHPAAFGLGLVVTAVATVAALYQLDRSASAAAALEPVRAGTATP